MKKYIGLVILGFFNAIVTVIFCIGPAALASLNVYAAIYTNGWVKFGNILAATLLYMIWLVFLYSYGNVESARQQDKKTLSKMRDILDNQIKR